VHSISWKFEQSFRSGQSASIESVLAEAPSEIRDSLFRELLMVELEGQFEKEELPTLSDVEARFPSDVDTVRTVYTEVTAVGAEVSDVASPATEQTRIVSADETDEILRKGQQESHDIHDEAESGAGGNASGESMSVGLGDIPEQFGRYRIERLLGEGGMGSVDLAHDSQLDRRVAIKIPKLDPRDDASKERFLREARSMATVSHPNLCPIHDVGEIDGRTFLSMAYIEGEALNEYLRSGQRVPRREAAAVIRKLALALHAAHESGIVHRDLKPANVMINSQLEPIIMDFGLAQRKIEGEATLTGEGAIVGSPAYMSPEQVEAEHHLIGPRTDVYALGVMLYEMLCGRRPFDGSAMSVLGRIVTSTPQRPSEVFPEIDSTLEAICQKAMARSSEGRFVSADHLAVTLCDWLNGLPVDLDLVPAAETRLRLNKDLGARSEPHLTLDGVADSSGKQSEVTEKLATEFFAARNRAKQESKAATEGPSFDPQVQTVVLAAVRKKKPGLATRMVALLMLVAVAGMAIYTIRTSNGDVTATAPEGADIEVLLKQNGNVVEVLNREGGWVARVERGTYSVSLRPKGKGGEIAFKLRGDDTLVVTGRDAAEVVIVSSTALKARPDVANIDITTSPPSIHGSEHRKLGTQGPAARSKLRPPVPSSTAHSAGQFVDSGQKLGSSSSVAVAAGDLDVDVDAVVLAKETTKLSQVWINEGDGAFRTGQPLTSYNPGRTDLKLGDMDADGHLDVVTLSTHRGGTV
jgi:serine/threonine protein kinase